MHFPRSFLEIMLLVTFGIVLFSSCHAVQNRPVIPLTNSNLRSALVLWYDAGENNRTAVEEIYGGPISAWNTSSITTLEGAFYQFRHFEADLSSWDVSAVTSLRAAFYKTEGFAGEIASWDISSVEDMTDLLGYSSNFQDDISQWITPSLTSLQGAFRGYSNTAHTAETLPISSWKTPNLKDMRLAFADTSDFQVDLAGWGTSKVTSMARMLEDTVRFYGGDLSLLDVSSVTTMEGMFRSAINVRSGRKVSAWNTSAVESMDQIFFKTNVIYTDDTPDDVFIFYLCWDLTSLKTNSLSQAFCGGHSGGFKCECVPEDVIRSINSGCGDAGFEKDQDHHCYGQLGDLQAELPESETTEADAPIDALGDPVSAAITYRLDPHQAASSLPIFVFICTLALYFL